MARLIIPHSRDVEAKSVTVAVIYENAWLSLTFWQKMYQNAKFITLKRTEIWQFIKFTLKCKNCNSFSCYIFSRAYFGVKNF